jgi:hypothetical protein
MENAVLDKDGRVANPVLCLYKLVDGTKLFSEEVEETSDSFVFDLTKTAMIRDTKKQLDSKEGEPISFEISLIGSRIAGTELAAPFGYTRRRLFKTSIFSIDTVSDAKALNAMRNMISHIILPS